MFNDTYRTIAGPAEGLYKEKGSKFLAFAFPIGSAATKQGRTVTLQEKEEEIKTLLEAKRKEYFDARHHCYAYILGADKANFRMNDDGEPSSTAGKPIHGQLLSLNLTDALVIVIRYFGGIKLGVSGLINAYKTAASDALSHAEIIEKTIDLRYHVDFQYPQMNDVMRILKQYDLVPQSQQYDMQCSLQFAVRRSLSMKVVDAFINLRTVKIQEVTSLNN